MQIKQVYIELTSSCNLRCKFCYNNSGTSNYELDFIYISELIKF